MNTKGYGAVLESARLSRCFMKIPMNEKANPIIREYFRFYGSVQGVGFRYRAAYAAELVGATGWVRNNEDGSVSMEIQGTESQIEKVLMRIRQGKYIRVDNVDAYIIPLVEGETGFGTR